MKLLNKIILALLIPAILGFATWVRSTNDETIRLHVRLDAVESQNKMLWQYTSSLHEQLAQVQRFDGIRPKAAPVFEP